MKENLQLGLLIKVQEETTKQNLYPFQKFKANFSSNEYLHPNELDYDYQQKLNLNKEVKFEDIETSRVFLKDTSIDQIEDMDRFHDSKSNNSTTARVHGAYINTSYM